MLARAAHPVTLRLIATALLTLWSAGHLAGQDAGDGYALPPQAIQDAFATDKNFATLDHPNPAGTHFLVPHVNELSTLPLMAEQTLRLAELELRPQRDRLWHLDTYGIDGLRIYSLPDRSFRDVDVPDGAYLSDLMWSPEGDRVAFLLHGREQTEVWSVSSEGGRARRLSNDRVLATLGTSAQGQGRAPSRMLQWTPEGSVLTLLVPEDREQTPTTPSVPAGPTVRRTRDSATPNPTYPNLLRHPHEADQFEHFTTSQIAEVGNGRTRRIGQPGMYESISLSPDGAYILARRITRPFSYIAPYRNFPRVTEVLDRDGNLLATLDETELREGRSGGRFGGGNDTDAARGWAWRPDGSGLSYLKRESARANGGPEEAARGGARPDRIYFLPAPFDTAFAGAIAESEDPIRQVHYSSDGSRMFATVTKDGESALVTWEMGSGTGSADAPRASLPDRRVLVDWYDPDDVTSLPGELWTARSGNGIEFAPLDSDGSAAFLRGPGYAEDLRPQPFVDRVSLGSGDTERIFEGSQDSFDEPLALLDRDAGVLIVGRESVHDFPDSYLWSESAGYENLTNNVDPFPEITAARRVDFTFERRDGLEIRGRISLPVDYVEGTKVPAIFWTYPREYRSTEDFENATIRSRNLNAHTQLSWLRWSDLWLLHGYALIYPDIPIVGENYNDYYISNMVDGMYAAVREVDRLGFVDIDRIGHGGHSYGAFATANFLAHTPYFKAGIAGDGAYNRSLTPQGFQAEPRNIWEAPNTYIEMSPFFKADQINTPLLMYHGADDNNTGTFPIQSERLMQALQGLGKNAVLYLYPFESHTPRAIENNLDMWARWLDWFDRYVKGAGTGIASDGG